MEDNKALNKKRILGALYTNNAFIKEYIKLFDKEPLFQGEAGCDKLEHWACSFYKKYGKVIYRDTQTVYDKAVQLKKVSKEELVFIDKLLVEISDEISRDEEDIKADSVEFLIDTAIYEMNRKKLNKLNEEISIALDKNDIESALKAKEKCKQLEKKSDENVLVDFLHATDVPELALTKDATPFMIARNAFEKEVFLQLIPSNVILIRGRSKSLKSYTIEDIALNCLFNKENAMIIGLGDLSKVDQIRRIICALAKKPLTEEQAARPIKVAHVDCMKNIHNDCFNIARTCNCPYKDSSQKVNVDYKACTACMKEKRPFPVSVSHTYENARAVITKEDIIEYQKLLSNHIGEKGIFDIYSYRANEKTATDLYDMVKSYFEAGKPLKIVCIDHFSQMRAEPSTMKSPMFERQEASMQILRNIAFDFNCVVIVADQAATRPQDGDSDWISESDYSGTQAKAQYSSAVITLNRSAQDKVDGIVRICSQFSRYSSLTAGEGGYILVCTALGKGVFNNESIYVSPAHISQIKECEKKYNPDDSKNKRKKFR